MYQLNYKLILQKNKISSRKKYYTFCNNILCNHIFFRIFEVVQAKLFEHQIIENNLYNNGQRIRNFKLFYCTIFIMLSNNSFLNAKIRFLSNYKNILLKKTLLGI